MARAYSPGIPCPECGPNWMPKKRRLQRPPSLSRRQTANAITPKGAAGTRPSAADREQSLALHGEQRQDLRIWTAVVEETDGCRGADTGILRHQL